ncbi:hypothetical protein D9M69_413880 [compost metagenome]
MDPGCASGLSGPAQAVPRGAQGRYLEPACRHPGRLRGGWPRGPAAAVQPSAVEPRRTDPRPQGLPLWLRRADHQRPLPIPLCRRRVAQAPGPGRRAGRRTAQIHRPRHRTPAGHAALQRQLRPVERRQRRGILADRLCHRLPPARPRPGLRRTAASPEEGQRTPAALPAGAQPDRDQLQRERRPHPLRRAGLRRLRPGP